MDRMTLFIILGLVLPITVALLSAFFLGLFLGWRFKRIPVFLKVLVAGILPVGLVLGYFIVWDRIEYAKHVAENGDVGWMGPIVLLVYTYPIWIIVFGLGFPLSLYAVKRAK